MEIKKVIITYFQFFQGPLGHVLILKWDRKKTKKEYNFEDMIYK